MYDATVHVDRGSPMTGCGSSHRSNRRSQLSFPPEILEPRRRKLGIAHRMLDVAMPEIRLQGASIVASIGQGISAGVTQHVRVSLEGQFGCPTGSFDHSREAGGCEWRTALGREYERRPWLLLTP
jgi:hypothetical protein